MPRPISVYESDSLHWRCELAPDPWEANQRLVTDEEFAEITALLESREQLKSLLAEIYSRPEWNSIEGKFEE